MKRSIESVYTFYFGAFDEFHFYLNRSFGTSVGWF